MSTVPAGTPVTIWEVPGHPCVVCTLDIMKYHYFIQVCQLKFIVFEFLKYVNLHHDWLLHHLLLILSKGIKWLAISCQLIWSVGIIELRHHRIVSIFISIHTLGSKYYMLALDNTYYVELTRSNILWWPMLTYMRLQGQVGLRTQTRIYAHIVAT